MVRKHGARGIAKEQPTRLEGKIVAQSLQDAARYLAATIFIGN
jgi:hypothetical protein